MIFTLLTFKFTLCMNLDAPMDSPRQQKNVFFVDNSNKKKWDDAEAACQLLGSSVHLATLDTQQACMRLIHVTLHE